MDHEGDGGAGQREYDDGAKEDLTGHDPEDLAFLHSEAGNIVLNNPKPPQRLGWFSVVCIICNRMIGQSLHSLCVSLKSRRFAPIRGIRICVAIGIEFIRHYALNAMRAKS